MHHISLINKSIKVLLSNSCLRQTMTREYAFLQLKGRRCKDDVYSHRENVCFGFKFVYSTYIMITTLIPLPCSSQMKWFKFLVMDVENAMIF